jgi:hypothetical protein
LIKEPDLPQLAEIKLPRQTDVAGGFLLYDRSMERVYLADAQTDERLRAAAGSMGALGLQECAKRVLLNNP